MSERDTSPIIRGKTLLLVMLVSIPVLFVATWVSLRNVEAKLAMGQAPLVWAQRGTWPTPPIKRTTLEDVSGGEFIPQPAEGKWQPLDFDLSPAVVAVVQQAADLATSDAFAGDATGAALRELAAQTPERLPRDDDQPAEQPHGFYLDYLLGAWHAARGESAEADAAFTRAFAEAPAVIKVQYLDPAGQPVADLPLGSATLGLDRVIDTDPDPDAFHGRLDQTLKLVYPHLATDATGTIYLPAFHTVYRWVEKPDPAGHDVRYFQAEGWFQFPGRIGAPRPAIVTPADAAPAE